MITSHALSIQHLVMQCPVRICHAPHIQHLDMPLGGMFCPAMLSLCRDFCAKGQACADLFVVVGQQTPIQSLQGILHVTALH